MDKVDIMIIGAGVIGLAIARELSILGKSTVVAERNKSFGQETSSRNSEVIHAGIYYPSSTLKARLCVEGRRLLYRLCSEKNIPCRKIGKLIVATTDNETEKLEELLIRGKRNGLEELKLLSRRQLNAMEPNVSAVAALYSPETGIIDSHRLMQYFLEDAREGGALVSFNSEVVAIERLSDGYKVAVKNGAEVSFLKTEILINSSGLDADLTAEIAGMDIKSLGYKLHYCKGQYFRLSGPVTGQINKLVYPVPEPENAVLGVHVTLDMAGGIRLGPDAEYLNTRNRNYSLDESKRRSFYLGVKKFLPFIEEKRLIPDTAGIRPKLNPQGGGFSDFIIRNEADRGLPGFINLIGIESPGLTSAIAIAGHVKGLLQ